MSHYAVAVFSYENTEKAFHDMLAPYSENNKDYFVFEQVTQKEIDEKWKKFHQQNPKWKYVDYLKEMFKKQDGKYGYYYNPHAKWDWYTLDGRDYLFGPKDKVKKAIRKAGVWPQFLKKSEINWKHNADAPSKKTIKKKWKLLTEQNDDQAMKDYYLKTYGTEEKFMESELETTIPYAFVTPDGAWHAPGVVGWFGTSDDTEESWKTYKGIWENFIKNGPDCYVSLVDCHI